MERIRTKLRGRKALRGQRDDGCGEGSKAMGAAVTKRRRVWRGQQDDGRRQQRDKGCGEDSRTMGGGNKETKGVARTARRWVLRKTMGSKGKG